MVIVTVQNVVLVNNGVETSLVPENKSKLSLTLTQSELPALAFGDNISFKKVNGSVKTLVTIQYSIMFGGYTRIMRDIVDSSTFAVNSDVISVLKKLRITQDPSLENNAAYYYVRETAEQYNAGIRNSATITVLQLDANNNVVSLQTQTYNPYYSIIIKFKRRTT